MTDQAAIEVGRNEGKAAFLTHFSQAFHDELALANDKAYFHLLGELLDTGIGSPVDMSEKLADNLLPLSNVYCEIYAGVTYDY